MQHAQSSKDLGALHSTTVHKHTMWPPHKPSPDTQGESCMLTFISTSILRRRAVVAQPQTAAAAACTTCRWHMCRAWKLMSA